MSRKEKANQWVTQATKEAKKMGLAKIVSILDQVSGEINQDTLPPIENRATGLLSHYIYQYPVDGILGELIEKIYYYFQLLPNGYNWSWEESKLSVGEVDPELAVVQAYVVNELEVINVSIDNSVDRISKPQDDSYDDSLFHIKNILSRIAGEWYVIYDSDSSEYISGIDLEPKEVIQLIKTTDADIRLCKLDFLNQDLMWALVEEYELGDGIALLNWSRFDPDRLKNWVTTIYKQVYDGDDLEIADIARPSSLAEILGDTDFQTEVRDLFDTVNCIALRFDTAPDEFILYRKQSMSNSNGY